MDKGKELNTKFNEIYNLISDVDNMVDMFYAEHILYNKDIDANSEIFSQVSNLQMMMSEVNVYHTILQSVLLGIIKNNSI